MNIENRENDNNSIEATKGSENRKRKKRFTIVGSLALTVCAALTVFAVIKVIQEEQRKREEQRQAIIQSGVFHEGIIVAGVNVGGMSMEQAKSAVSSSEKAEREKIRFTLTLNGEVFNATDGDFNISFNTDEVLAEAMSVGRGGTLKELTELLEDLKVNNRTYEIAYTADEIAVRDFVASIAESVYKEPQDARMTSIQDPRTLTADKKKSDSFVKSASTTSSDERMSYTAEVQGVALDGLSVYYSIIDMFEKNEYHDLELPTKAIPADVTLQNIAEKYVLRGKASTSYAKSPYNRSSRVYNIRKAVSLVNGVVIQPGETFSTNDTLGNRTYSSGWKGAPAIVGGDTEDQAGGGVCQVSTTMYNCVLVSDLEVVDRRGHSSKIGYVAGGLDATIDSGHIDFQWMNNTGSPIYVFAWVDTKRKTVNFEMYGEPFPEGFDEVKVSSKKISTISPASSMKYIYDEDMEPGESRVTIARKYGSVWESYVTYLKDGEVVYKKTLGRTTYKAYSGEKIVGPEIVEVASGE